MTIHNPETIIEDAYAVLRQGLDPLIMRSNNRVSMLGLFIDNSEAERAQRELQALGLDAKIVEGKRVSLNHEFSNEQIAHLQNATFERLRNL